MQEIKYFDVHGHISFPDYDKDRDEVVARAGEAGIAMVTVGTDINTSRRAIEIAEKYENVWATVGMHPVHSVGGVNDPKESGIDGTHACGAQEFEHSSFESIARHPKVLAIGECGLDYFHIEKDQIHLEIETFESQIKLANQLGKPLMLHVRNPSKKIDNTVQSAYLDAVALLKEQSQVPFDFHFFSGDMNDARAILDIGGYVSFDGPITFSHDYDEVIRYIPLDRIMSETDCPYVAPAPYRGKRNEPLYVVEIVNAISRIRGQDIDTVREQLLQNARNFFGM